MSGETTDTAAERGLNTEIVPPMRFPEFRGGDGWMMEKVDILVDTITPPKKLATSAYALEGSFPIIDQSQSDICGWTDDNEALIRENVPLIVFGDHTCILKLIERPFAQGADGIKILKARSLILAHYLYQYLNYRPVVTEEYKRHFSILKEKNVFFPKLRSGEQQKIANCLTSIDELITAQAQKVEALKTDKKGLIQQLFPREGESEPRLRFPEFRGSGEWEEKTVECIIKINSGKGFKASEYSDSGIRLLQIENVGYGRTIWNENTNYLPKNYASQYPELVLKTGDIVLALNRPVTNDELKIARIEENDGLPILYQRVGRLVIVDDNLDVDFAFHLFRQFIKDFVVKKSIGSDQPFISLRDLYAQKILIPSKFEQREVANCLTPLDALISFEAQKLEYLDHHKRGLMQQLFPSPDEVAA